MTFKATSNTTFRLSRTRNGVERLGSTAEDGVTNLASRLVSRRGVRYHAAHQCGAFRQVKREDAIARMCSDRMARSYRGGCDSRVNRLVGWFAIDRRSPLSAQRVASPTTTSRTPRHSCGSQSIAAPVDRRLHCRSARHGCNDAGAASRNPGWNAIATNRFALCGDAFGRPESHDP